MIPLSQADLSSIPHLSELVAARTYDRETQIYECQHGSAICFEILPFIGFEQTNMMTLTGLINEIDLAKGSIQILNWANGRIAKSLNQWSKSRKQQKFGFVDKRVALFKDITANPEHDLPSKHHWQPRHYRVFFILQFSGDINETRRTELVRLHQRILQTFATLGTQCRSVPPKILLELYHEIFLPDLSDIDPISKTWSEDELINEQITPANTAMDVSFRHVDFSGDFSTRMKTFSVIGLPEEWRPGASATLIGDIFRTSAFCSKPLIQSVSFTASAMSGDVIGMRASRADRAAKSSARFLNPGVVDETKDLTEVATDIAKGNKLVTMHYQTVLFSELNTFENAETKLRHIFESSGFDLVSDNGLHLPALQAALPFGGSAKSINTMKRFRRTRTVKECNALTLSPLFGEWQGNDFRHPGLMLLAGRRGELASWTPFESDGNYNVCIVGQSGQGKSVAMQEMMAALMNIDGAVVVIDDGYSFKNSASVLGGRHVDFGHADIQINPFAAIDPIAMRDDPDFARTGISMLTNFISALCHPGTKPSDMEQSVLTDAVQTVWENNGVQGTIDGVVASLKKRNKNSTSTADKKICDELTTLLGPVTSKGAYGAIFSGGCSVNMNEPLLVFEMSHLRDQAQVQAAAMVLLIFLSTQKMYHTGREQPVAIMIDEAWALLDGTTADFVEGVARRARKYFGSLITATQGVDDYFTSEAAKAAWANSSWRLFFRMQDASIETLKTEKRIICDDVLERGLRSLNSIRDVWSELIVHGQNGWDIARLILDPVSLAAFSSTAEDVAAIENLMKDGKSRSEAILHHASSKTRL